MANLEQASIDVLAELGYLSTTSTMITLMQSIKQARWPDDGILSLLPGIEPSTEKSLRENGAIAPPLPKNLARLSQLPDKDLRKIADLAGIPQAGAGRRNFLLAASSIPQISISVTTATASALSASLARQNASQRRDFRIHAPKFPKPQTEGWFVLLGDSRKDELYALKRVGWPTRGGAGGGKPSVKFSLGLPEGGVLEGLDATLIVMSDGYLGLVQRTGVHLQTTQVVPGTWIEKEGSEAELGG